MIKFFSLLQIGQISAVVFSSLIVAFVLFVWAAFIRKPDEKHGRHDQHHWRHAKVPGSTEEPGRRRGIVARFRRRRHRRKERRNPTLAETGGLPSVRGDEPGPSRPI